MIYAATGHRPHKLGGYNIAAESSLIRLACGWLAENRATIEHVISGMAQGWDQAWAMAAIQYHIKLVAMIPFKGQESQWPQPARMKYQRILAQCHAVHVVNDGAYAVWKMQARNEAMVDAAGEVVALWDGSAGGTFNCIQYAHLQNKKIHNLWDRYNAT